jgi:hypothetical protein
MDKWDVNGRHKKIVLALVKQCEDEDLTVEEAKYVLECAIGEISRQGNSAKVNSERTIQKYQEDAHKLENMRQASH